MGGKLERSRGPEVGCLSLVSMQVESQTRPSRAVDNDNGFQLSHADREETLAASQ